MLPKKIVIVTKNGMIIKFSSLALPEQKKGGVGTKAMTLRQDDEIVAAFETD